MTELMKIDCDEWREIAELFPEEMKVLVEMLLHAEAERCEEVTIH
jgi:hypothetical protein